MKSLLVINFLIKLLAQKNIFKLIKEKYGHTYTALARQLEDQRTKLAKTKCDVKFLSTCKRNNLIPTFANPKLSIKTNQKFKLKIAKSIIEEELRNKHRKLNWLRNETKRKAKELKDGIGFVSFCVTNKKINLAISAKVKKWKGTHDTKLRKLFRNKESRNVTTDNRPNDIVHNFSSYKLDPEEEYILSFSLDHHIPSQENANSIKTEFEAFYHHFDKNTKNNINSNDADTIKSKIRRTCENYIRIPQKNEIR